MSVCATIVVDPNGTTHFNPNFTESLDSCSEFIIFDPETASNLLSLIDDSGGSVLIELLGITPSSILYIYTWGMGAVLMMWALGYAVGAAKKGINLL